MSKTRASMTGITYGELYFALDHLSQLHRKVIYLRFWNDKSIAEIATDLRINWDLADSLITEALKILKTYLKGNL
jgi:DNA-directed RNA polymerase specialized sigma24 family protein